MSAMSTTSFKIKERRNNGKDEEAGVGQAGIARDEQESATRCINAVAGSKERPRACKENGRKCAAENAEQELAQPKEVAREMK